MKNLIPIAFLLLLSSGLFAQTSRVQYGLSSFQGTTQTASNITIEKMDADDVKKKWISYLKNYKGKVKNQKGEITVDNAKIPAISPDTLDLFSKVEESGDDVVISIGVNRNGTFINNASGQNVAVDDLLIRFATNLKKDQAELEVETAEKALKLLEADRREMAEENKKMEKDISEMKSKIADNERSIKSNEKSLGEMDEKIRTQENLVKELKSKVGEYK